MAVKKAKPIGVVTHYYDHINVAVLKLTKALSVGDKIKFLGHGVDFTQEVDSLQIEHKPIAKAKKGDSVGLKVNQKVSDKTEVYLVK